MRTSEYLNKHGLTALDCGFKVAIIGFDTLSAAKRFVTLFPKKMAFVRHLIQEDDSKCTDVGAVKGDFSSAPEMVGFEGSAISKGDLLHTISVIRKNARGQQDKTADCLESLLPVVAKLREGHEVLVYSIVNGKTNWDILPKNAMKCTAFGTVHHIGVVMDWLPDEIEVRNE